MTDTITTEVPDDLIVLDRKPEPAKAGPVMLTLRTHDGTAVEYPKPKSKATFNQTAGPGMQMPNEYPRAAVL